MGERVARRPIKEEMYLGAVHTVGEKKGRGKRAEGY